MSSNEDKLSIQVQNGALIVVAGELDLATAPQLQSTAERLHTEDNRDLCIDLSGITFCDSTGLGILIWAHNTLSAAGRLVLVNPSRHLQQLITLTGLEHLLQPRPTK